MAALAIGKWSMLLLFVWPLQYMLVVPTVIGFKLARMILKAAVMVGIIGLVLAFIPVVGWLILLLIYVNDRNHQELLEAINPSTSSPDGSRTTGRSIFRPWGV